WTNLGLASTGHIGKIVINPSNTNIIYVATLGLYRSRTEDRGVYKTTNGGGTWSRTLFVNDTTGATDILMDPTDPTRVLAATWTYYRTFAYVVRAGRGSGLYGTINSGVSWSLIQDGFPNLN